MRTIQLTSLTASDGFLQKANVTFSGGLNCIIGARGTCKSTVVESIRFACNVDPSRVREIIAERNPASRSAGIVRETLGVGSVRCEFDIIEEGEPTRISIEREIGDDPRILRGGKRDMVYGDVLDEIEIFSQGDIQRIASEDAPDLRLQLIDRPKLGKITELKSLIAQDAARLRDIGTKLRILRSEIEGYRVQLKSLDQVRAELARTVETRPAVPASLEELHAQYLKRQRTIDLMKEMDSTRNAILNGLRETVVERKRLDDLAQRATDEREVASEVPADIVRQIQAVMNGLVALGKTLGNVSVTEATEQLTRDFAVQNEAYVQKRQMEKTATESLRREDVLRRQLAELETAQRKLEHLEGQQQELMTQRRELREHLTTQRDEIFELRVDEAERINQQFGQHVLLAVKRATRSQRYVQKVTELMAGSRIRMQGNIADEIASTILPDELLELVEAGDSSRLATLLQRDLGQATRALAYLRDHAELYDLEGEWTDDTLEITMFDNGVPKSVEELSDGQKATALLPLILRDSSGPLIIDQPEDDLDNSFIYQSLVKSILKLKSDRQLIFVTHNANIPVLGDAETVVVMDMETPKRAAQPRIGNLDASKRDILKLLEGGKEAFALREQVYGKLLK
jgi:ABC-type uncharacterized transport system ATPase subunit